MTGNALTVTNDLPARAAGATIEVQCPCCGKWRPGFCVTELEPTEALGLGAAFACDGCLTRQRRAT